MFWSCTVLEKHSLKTYLQVSKTNVRTSLANPSKPVEGVNVLFREVKPDLAKPLSGLTPQKFYSSCWPPLTFTQLQLSLRIKSPPSPLRRPSPSPTGTYIRPEPAQTTLKWQDLAVRGRCNRFKARIRAVAHSLPEHEAVCHPPALTSCRRRPRGSTPACAVMAMGVLVSEKRTETLVVGTRLAPSSQRSWQRGPTT